jgi:hypothetical protein
MREIHRSRLVVQRKPKRHSLFVNLIVSYEQIAFDVVENCARPAPEYVEGHNLDSMERTVELAQESFLVLTQFGRQSDQNGDAGLARVWQPVSSSVADSWRSASR